MAQNGQPSMAGQVAAVEVDSHLPTYNRNLRCLGSSRLFADNKVLLASQQPQLIQISLLFHHISRLAIQPVSRTVGFFEVASLRGCPLALQEVFAQHIFNEG
ncbi:MAG: hypothetical protein JO159_13420 [Acidobacteria bacterium]|nr:hypothetical protein [Acidobacteriota bacterium]